VSGGKVEGRDKGEKGLGATCRHVDARISKVLLNVQGMGSSCITFPLLPSHSPFPLDAMVRGPEDVALVLSNQALDQT